MALRDIVNFVFEYIAESFDEAFKRPGLYASEFAIAGFRAARAPLTGIFSHEMGREIDEEERAAIGRNYERAGKSKRAKSKSY